MHQLTW